MVWSLQTAGYSAGRKLVMPRSISHLKTEMVMKNLLREIYSIDYSDVRSMSVTEKVSAPGDITGNLSESGRLVVRVVMNSGETQVFNWFVKVMPKQHRNSDLMNQFNIFENEISFYKNIAPDLLNFLNENGVKDIQFDIPKLLFADNREDGAVIILEDVSEQGFRQDRDAQGGRFLSVEKAELAISAIARVHAASKLYDMHQVCKLEERHTNLRHSSMWEDTGFLGRLSVMRDTYCEVLRKSSEHDSARLLQRFQKTFDSGPRLKSLCAERYTPKQEAAHYLQHGDFHYNNLLFKETESEGLRVMVVDWQLTYTGRSTGDVSYLLLSSVRPEVRHHHEQRLKEFYFAKFNSYLKSFESSFIERMHVSADCSDAEDSDVEVDVEDLEHDYHDSAPLSLFLSCGNVLASDTDRLATPEDSEDEWDQATVSFAYNLVKEAAQLDII